MHLITRIFDLGAFVYDLLIKIWLRGREKTLRKEFIQLAELKGDERILDIGCATGTLDIMIAESFLGEKGSVSGVDISPNMIAGAKRKAEKKGYNIDFRVGSSTELPYESDEFDTVFTLSLYAHLDYEEKNKTLAEIHRVLKPDGKYISADYGKLPGILVQGGGGLYPPRLLEENGFAIVKEFPVTSGPMRGLMCRVVKKKG